MAPRRTTFRCIWGCCSGPKFEQVLQKLSLRACSSSFKGNRLPGPGTHMHQAFSWYQRKTKASPGVLIFPVGYGRNLKRATAKPCQSKLSQACLKLFTPRHGLPKPQTPTHRKHAFNFPRVSRKLRESLLERSDRNKASANPPFPLLPSLCGAPSGASVIPADDERARAPRLGYARLRP